jgi:hypothetical protein
MWFGDNTHIDEWSPGDFPRGKWYECGGGLIWIWEVEELMPGGDVGVMT